MALRCAKNLAATRAWRSVPSCGVAWSRSVGGVPQGGATGAVEAAACSVRGRAVHRCAAPRGAGRRPVHTGMVSAWGISPGAGSSSRGDSRRGPCCSMSTSDASGDEAADFDLDWLDEDDADEGAAATSGSTAALEGSLAGGGAQRGAGEGDAGDGTRRGQPSQAEDPEVAALLRAVPDLTMAEQRRAADLALKGSYTQTRFPNDVVITPLPKHEGYSHRDSPMEEKLASVRDLSQRIWRVENRHLLEQSKYEENEKRQALTGGQRLGPGVNYCVFCYHGEELLQATFVTEKGALLPKRFTACCAKHQRKLARTVKHARHANLLPYTRRLHPKLRFTSLRPPVSDAAAEAEAAASEEKGGDPFVRDALDELRNLMKQETSSK